MSGSYIVECCILHFCTHNMAGSLEEMFYGFMISIILFGISVTQAWSYLNINHDRWPMRVWVGIILICNLTHIIMVSQSTHYYLMPSAGIAITISSPMTLVALEWVLTGIIQIGLNARTTFREMFEVSALPTFSLRFAETPNLNELPETRVSQGRG
ncbi:hypothetical protein BD779DRAFT_1542144 [Infundibulicybe gibba]|nr:hypothetical protein BD779DRAFT_1542144 [Infundibulicybe gibba]